MNEIRENGLVYFQIPGWDRRDLTVHAFFSRIGGVSHPPFDTLNMGVLSKDTLSARKENLRRISSALGVRQESISCLRQVHEKDIVRIQSLPERTTMFTRGGLLVGDAQITDQKGITIGVLTADCLPIFLLDPVRPALGAVHAGWRSSFHRICVHALRAMRNAFGTDPGELLILMGPCIGSCCYVIGDDVAREFLDSFSNAARFLCTAGPGIWKLDLRALNREQLVESGVRPHQITSIPLCTCCRRDLFFSVRAQGEPTGRQISLLGLRPD